MTAVESLPWGDIAEYAKTNSLRFCYDALVKHLGVCSFSTFRKWCAARGVRSVFSGPAPARTGAPYSENDKQLIADMRANGNSHKEIGERLGRSEHAIDLYCQKHKIKHKLALRAEAAAKELAEVDWAAVFNAKREKRRSFRSLRNEFAPNVSEWSFTRAFKKQSRPLKSTNKLDAFMPVSRHHLLSDRVVFV